VTDQSTRDPGRDEATSPPAEGERGAEAERGASPREEAERLVAASLGAVATALHGIEARRQLRMLAEQVFGADRLDDLTAGMNGYVSGVGPDGGGAGMGARATDGGPGGGVGGAATGGGGVGFATGSANCCICPVCRVIAALRDPSPEFAERVASSVGDLAVGLTGLLRSLGTVLGTPDRHDSWAAATADPPRPASGGGT
jgi:hypothetical protein